MNFRALISRAAGTGAGFLLAAAAAFGANVVLSNLLDPDGYGAVALMLTWVTVAAQFAQLGFLRGATKIVSVARMRGAPGTIKAFLIFVTGAVAISGVLGGLALFGAIRVLSPAGTTFWTLAGAAGLMLWPLAMCRVCGGVMLGENRGLAGAFFQNGLPHAGILLGAVGIAAWHGGVGFGGGGFGGVGLGGGGLGEAGLSAVMPAILAGACMAALCAAGAVAWAARDTWPVVRGRFEAGPWLSLALPLMMVGMIQLLNRQVGTIIVGALDGTESVAAYFPALRISEFSTFGLIAVNAAVAARLSTAHGRRDHGLLQSTLTKAAVLTLASTIVLVTATLVLDDFLLGLFGGPAQSADTALWILLIGQVVNAATGSVGILMAMAGQERFAAMTAGAVLVVNIALHFLLVPAYGIEGAAIATASSAILWNLSLFGRSFRVLGVNPTVFTRGVLGVFRSSDSRSS